MVPASYFIMVTNYKVFSVGWMVLGGITYQRYWRMHSASLSCHCP